MGTFVRNGQSQPSQPAGDGAEAEEPAQPAADVLRGSAPPRLDDREYDRLVGNKFVMPRASQAVHPEYRDSIHDAPGPLKPDTGLDLVIGIDPRSRPSAAFMQHRLNGQ